MIDPPAPPPSEPLAGAPSAFFLAERWRFAGRNAPVLDLACGRGRHAVFAAREGHSVIAADRNGESLSAIEAELAAQPLESGSLRTLVIDLEQASGPEPADPALLAEGSFAAVLVFRYLHRPLAAWIESLLEPGGILLYETFTTAQRELGWGPSRDAFLLAPGELRSLFPGLEIVSFAEGLNQDENPAQTARLVARRPPLR